MGGVVKYADLGTELNKALWRLFRKALRISFKDPYQTYFFIRALKWQKKAARIRRSWNEAGLHVPPALMLSVTDRCNLECRGCFPRGYHLWPRPEMDESKIKSILTEAQELGISIVLIFGGEPLVRPEILHITREFPQIIFLLFTNGLLINEHLLHKLEKQKNLLPILSLEGYEEDTDHRRGKGVYEQLLRIFQMMRDRGIFWGASFTVMKRNIGTLADEEFINQLIRKGCKLFFFVEYVPVKGGPENWVLTEEERGRIVEVIDSFHSRLNALFFAFPGDEAKFGGCLSAGRGFCHISPTGDLEPCPFVPASDSNLRELSLQDALRSEFLRSIRQNLGKLAGGGNGCILRQKGNGQPAALM